IAGAERGAGDPLGAGGYDPGSPGLGGEASGAGFRARTHPVDTEERPPMREIPEYTARRRAA
ncbi:hypothetical protein AN216_00045, partial [Streptomyces oceani]